MASEPKTILIIAVPMLGDVLLTTPLIRSVKEQWPEASIDVITPPGGAILLEGNADVREALEPRKRPVSTFLAFVLRRFRRYDLALSNSASDRALLYAMVMAKRRISIVLESRGDAKLKRRLYDAIVNIDYARYNTIVQNLMLLDVLNIGKSYEVTLPSSPDSSANLDKVLGARWREQSLAVIHPVSSASSKCWHREGWHAVVDWLARRGLRVLVTGGPHGQEIAYIDETLKLTAGRAESLAGKISLADVALLLKHSRLYIGVDTLISHMAAAAGTPTVVLFGPVNPVTWGPWPKGFRDGDSPWEALGNEPKGNVTIVQGDPDVVARDQAVARWSRGSSSESMETLTAARVIEAAERALDG